MEASCDCYNVRVFIQNPIKMDDLCLTDEELKHEFFNKALYKVKSGGCQEVQPCLIKSQIIGSWNVRLCLVCNLYTHAISYLSGDVLCTGDVNDKIQKASECQNYSKVFRILLPTDLEFDDTIDSLSSNFSIAEQATLVNIEKQATRIIQKMGQRVESSIETFMSKQRNVLGELKDKAKLDANVLSQLFIKARRKSEVASAAKNISNIHETESDGATCLDYNTASGFKVNTFTVPIREDSLEGDGDKNLFELLTPEENPMKSKDALGIFDMDEFNFETSERDQYEDEDSDNEVPVPQNRCLNKKHLHMDIAKSAPVNVPAFAVKEEKQPSYKSPADVQEIAESIQNLANSVRCTSADVFGERPPPRKPKDI